MLVNSWNFDLVFVGFEVFGVCSEMGFLEFWRFLVGFEMGLLEFRQFLIGFEVFGGFIWNGYILKFSEFSIGNWFMVTWSEVDIVGFWGFFSSYWCLGVWFEFAYCVILFMFWWWCGLGGGGLLKKTGCQWYYLCWNGSFVLISLVSFQLGSFGK